MQNQRAAKLNVMHKIFFCVKRYLSTLANFLVGFV